MIMSVLHNGNQKATGEKKMLCEGTDRSLATAGDEQRKPSKNKTGGTSFLIESDINVYHIAIEKTHVVISP